METNELLERIYRLGVSMTLDGDDIVLKPGDKVPAGMLPELKVHKTALVRHLRRLHEVSTQERTRAQLLAWASELVNNDVVTESPVTFNETPLRPVRTTRISFYARQYLQLVAAVESARQGLTWEPWTVEWHEERAREAIEALENLRPVWRSGYPSISMV